MPVSRGLQNGMVPAIFYWMKGTLRVSFDHFRDGVGGGEDRMQGTNASSTGTCMCVRSYQCCGRAFGMLHAHHSKCRLPEAEVKHPYELPCPAIRVVSVWKFMHGCARVGFAAQFQAITIMCNVLKQFTMLTCHHSVWRWLWSTIQGKELKPKGFLYSAQ